MADYSSLGSILDPTAGLTNPLDYARQLQGFQGNALALQKLRAEQAAGEAYQASINQQTGELDPNEFRRQLAARPGAAMAAGTSLNNIQGISSNQFDMQKVKLGWYNGALGALPDNASKDQILSTIRNGVAHGMFSPEDAAREASQVPDDDAGRASWLQQHRITAASAMDQFHVQYGTPFTVHQGTGVTGGTVDSKTGALRPAGEGVPVYGSPEFWKTPKDWVAADGKTTVHGTNQSYNDALNRGEVYAPPGQPAPRPATQAPTSGNPPTPPAGPLPTGYQGRPGAPAPASSAPAPAPAVPSTGLPTSQAPPTAGFNLPTITAPGGNQLSPQSSITVPGNAFAGPGAPPAGGSWTQPPAAVPGGAGAFLAGRAGVTPVAAPAMAVGTMAGPPVGSEEATKITAGDSAKAGSALMGRADQVPQNKANYAQMLTDLSQIQSGPSSEKETAINAFLQKWTGAGITMTPQQVAAANSFAKLANIAVSQQLAAIGGTDARQQLFMGSNPNLDLTKLSNTQIIHMLQGNEDAISAKATAWREWLGSGHGSDSYQDFQNDFNHHFDPRVFQQQYMGPDEIAALRKSMTGPGQLQKFKDDVAYAREHNWIQ